MDNWIWKAENGTIAEKNFVTKKLIKILRFFE